MKRVGILTFWGVPNYGAWTQAYALNHVVRELLGETYDVRHIDYLHPKHYAGYYEKDARLENNFAYSYHHIPHTTKMSEKELETTEFDLMITGSDAIWEFSIDMFGDDRHLIGNELRAKRLIAYAPSFGTMSPEDEYEDWVKAGLKKYDVLSVRDQNSAEIVKKIIGVEPQIVLDPALLWDFNKDTNVIPSNLKSYILVYGAKWSEEFIAEARSFAEKKGCKLVSAGFINDWCDLSFRMTELRSFEWLGMFKNASYVLASTFHGLMLGLAFQKQIKFCFVPYVRNRSRTLLQKLGMEFMCSEEIGMEELFAAEMDYKQINERLEKLREASLNYLKYAADGETL